ncbi:hypothetical protein LCGC14_0555030 [marine sediment metagenome]|uniref:Uncharacterized protein n=1 Tax=marine sediment metagenome TaxID=412755 RepID=A0A0F9S7C0_9ZZZZ
MANGPKQGMRGWGIKIKNPLPLTVRVKIQCETGALRTGDGKGTWRTIPPGEELYLSTKGQCELDITTTILKFDPAGKENEVGPAELRQTHHQAPSAKRLKKKVETTGMYAGSSRQWEEVVSWRAGLGVIAWLDSVEISAQLYGFADYKVLVGNKVIYGPAALNSAVTLHPGDFVSREAVKVFAMSRAGGDIEVTAKLKLRQEAGLGTVSGKSAEVTDGEPIREDVPPEEREEAEVPIRTLGDQIADLRKQEVSV